MDIKISDKIELIEIKKIKPYERNPRNNKEAIPKVAESIKKFGFRNPIILDSKNTIIAGHTRYEASKKLGLTEVPCIYANDLTETEVKALRLIDNKTGEYSVWEQDLLNDEVKDIMTAGMDLEEFGLSLNNPSMAIDEIVEDEPPELPKEPKSKTGEIYSLGEHRLMVGDSTKAEDVSRLMNGNLADLVVTDPPYNVAIGDKNAYKTRAPGRKAGKSITTNIANDKMSDEAFKEFLIKAFSAMKDNLKAGGVFYIWHSNASVKSFLIALEENGLLSRQTLTWVKQHFCIGRQDYQNSQEHCLYGWKEGTKHYFINNRSLTTVWEDDPPDIDNMTKDDLKKLLKTMYADILTDVIHEKKPQKSELHPTMKPVKLIARQIFNSSKKGEIVLDLFGGSGTTMIACEEMGRKCYMMEYDPHYADVIIERWENKTGKQAKKVE